MSKPPDREASGEPRVKAMREAQAVTWGNDTIDVEPRERRQKINATTREQINVKTSRQGGKWEAPRESHARSAGCNVGTNKINYRAAAAATENKRNYPRTNKCQNLPAGR